MIAYHFIKGNKLRDGSTAPPDGVWLEHHGTLEMCAYGLHASQHVADAVRYAPGTTLCLVELGGEMDATDDKVVASRRKIIARFDATELLRHDARQSALMVAHLWKMPDVVREYLNTGNESLRFDAKSAAYAAYAAAAADAAAVYAAAAADAAAVYADAAVYTAVYAAAAAAGAAAAYADAAAADAAAAYAAYADAAAAYAAAALSSTRAECRARLQAAVDAKFKEMGVSL